MVQRVITAEMPVTIETLETALSDDAIALLPRHDKEAVQASVGISRATLHRYVAEVRPALTCAEVAGKLLFSDEDIGFLIRCKGAKSDHMRRGLSDSQRERIAQLTAGVGRRQEAEALRRQLRAQGEGVSLRARVRLLLDAVPALRTMRTMPRLVWYCATFYQTTDLSQLDTATVSVSGVERAFREVLKEALPK